METTEKLISSLAEAVTPVKPASHPFARVMRWFAGALLYVAAVLMVMGLRSDISDKIHSPLFVAELMALLSLIASTSLSAILLSYPDMFQKRLLAYLPVVFLVLFGFVLGLEWFAAPAGVPQPPHNVECLICITALSIIPGAFILYLLRRQASVRYYLSGMVALLAAFSMGCLALRLQEHNDSISHLLKWHYGPMIGAGLLGLWLGRKLLKW